MSSTAIETKRLKLKPQSRDEVRAQIERMGPQEKAQLSSAWLALLAGSGPTDPWIHGFAILGRDYNAVVGRCGFKGPPGPDGIVEIAYGVNPKHQGKGYATEAAGALTGYAFHSGRAGVVRAHTLPGRTPRRAS